MKKLIALLLVLCMAIGLLAACGQTPVTPDTPDTPNNETQNSDTPEQTTAGSSVEATGPKYGGHANIHVYSQPTGLDPLKQTGMWKYIWLTCVYENALTRDADNNVVPGLCNFELSEDKLTLKLWVREGAVFHNGDPVEITDVVASINRALKMYENIKMYLAPFVKDITVDGDTATMTFTAYNERAWGYLAAYQTWIAVLPQEICEKYSATYITDQMDDAIGTGPYKITGFEGSVSVSIEKFDGYVPCEAGYTGYGAPKMGYLDSMTFFYNADNSSATMALLAGDYDVTDVIDEEYMDMATEAGIIRETLPSNVGTCMIFNTMGTNNICSKYPALRKAVMAAINYEELLDVITDGASQLGGTPVVSDRYATDVFENADYFGDVDLDVVEAYLDEAYDAGYDDEPVQIVCDNTRTDLPALLTTYLDEAGINYDLQTMELATYNEFIGKPSNTWDFNFYWPTYSFTPSTMPLDFIINNYKSEAKDDLLDQMSLLDPESDEYLALWTQLSEMMVEDCAVAHMGTIDWYWYHPATFHSNDEGLARFMYNAYWDDPENHPAN